MSEKCPHRGTKLTSTERSERREVRRSLSTYGTGLFMGLAGGFILYIALVACITRVAEVRRVHYDWGASRVIVMVPGGLQAREAALFGFVIPIICGLGGPFLACSGAFAARYNKGRHALLYLLVAAILGVVAIGFFCACIGYWDSLR